MNDNVEDKLSGEYPEWCHKPFKLTLGEIKNPIEVLEEFCETYTLPDIREDLQTWLWYALDNEDIKGGHFFQLYQDIEKLIEAAYVILKSKEAEGGNNNRESVMDKGH